MEVLDSIVGQFGRRAESELRDGGPTPAVEGKGREGRAWHGNGNCNGMAHGWPESEVQTNLTRPGRLD
jgi:hypothetical protein